LLYTKEHEWARVEGNLAYVGITDYAQSSLGEIVFVECPKIGKRCEQFKQFATIESVKSASDLFAPFSGRIVKVNEQIQRTPEIINQSPYEQGWLVVIEIEDEKEKENLLSSSAYKEYIKALSD